MSSTGSASATTGSMPTDRGAVPGAPGRFPSPSCTFSATFAGSTFSTWPCGSGGWSAWLAERGARVVGVDPSPRQLAHAGRLRRERGIEFALVEARAEQVPLANESFDLVVSDYGACSWSEPLATVAEAARLLRPGGRFVANTTSPIAHLCWDFDRGFGEALARDYFGLHVLEQPWGVTGYQLRYGEWIALFRSHGLAVDALVELQPRDDAREWPEWIPLAWARRWPGENVWVARKLAHHGV